MRDGRSAAWALSLLVALVALVAFTPSLSGEFLNWDDGVGLVRNDSYRGLGWSHVRWAFTNTHVGHYMPLTWLSFGVNYVLAGMSPWGYHVANVLLHGVNAGVFLLIAVRLLTAVGQARRAHRVDIDIAADAHPAPAIVAGALLASLLFAVHPQRVEPVAWITGRATLLSGFFYLVAVLGYLRATAGAGPIRWKWAGAASVSAFVAAVLAHPIAMTLPLSLLVLDVCPLQRGREWRDLIREKIPYAAVALVGAGLAGLARRQGVLWTPAASRDLESRLLFGVQSLWLYPTTFAWPSGLSPLYELPDGATVSSIRFLLPLLGVAATVTLLYLGRYRFPGGLAAWLHMAIVVAPVSGLVHSGIQLGADRYSYQADLGFALLVGYGLTWALLARDAGRISPLIVRLICGVAIVVVVALSAGSWGYAATWQDSETLWRWATDADQQCANCRVHLSEAIITRTARQGPDAMPARAREAEEHARRALALRPDLADAYFNLGTALAAQQRYDEADVALRAYMQRAPWDPAGPWRLGLLRLVQSKPVEAVPLFRVALDLSADSLDLRGQVDAVLREQASQLERSGRHAEASVLLSERARLVEHGSRRATSP
jgi:protein O-mannosyl-transferase